MPMIEPMLASAMVCRTPSSKRFTGTIQAGDGRGRRRDRHRGCRRLPGHQRTVDPRELRYEVVGDERLARDIVDALPALAVL